ncbi:hypothetical protein E2320_011436 [Naja naja]|nr:hypothetical protein E2320_011436 [Naja naja]
MFFNKDDWEIDIQPKFSKSTFGNPDCASNAALLLDYGIRQGARGSAEFVSKSHESNVGTRPRVTLARLLYWEKETSWRL